jgi:DNA repair photolyase
VGRRGCSERLALSVCGGSTTKLEVGSVFSSLKGMISWREYEPGTPSPRMRLENIERLKSVDILPEIRIDPIIPFVTDTEPEMDSIFRGLKNLDIKKVTLSYLHLRPAIHLQLMREPTS